jgi:hypothetical protein
MLRRTLAIWILASCMLGCGEANPIIGVWVVDPRAGTVGAEAAAIITGKQRIEFREDKRIIADKSTDVRYEVTGDRVIVTESEQGQGVVYTILDPNRIEIEIPPGILLVYQREGADAAAPGAGSRPTP